MTPADTGPDSRAASTELLQRVCGTSLEPGRLEALLLTHASLLEEIARLRALDLADVHPAIVFEPTAVYRRER